MYSARRRERGVSLEQVQSRQRGNRDARPRRMLMYLGSMTMRSLPTAVELAARKEASAEQQGRAAGPCGRVGEQGRARGRDPHH